MRLWALAVAKEDPLLRLAEASEIEPYARSLVAVLLVRPPLSCGLDDGGRAHLKNVELVRGGRLASPFSVRISSIVCRKLEWTPPASGAA
jgi:hypothetical protein